MSVSTNPVAEAASLAEALEARPSSPSRTSGTGRPKIWLYIVLAVGFVAMIFPFIWMILGSFKTNAEIRANPLGLLPADPTLDNYTQLFGRLDFTTFFTNSVVVAVCVTLGNIVFSSMVGYALAKLEFRGKKLLFVLVLGTLMVPGVVTFVPLFVLTSNLGLVNSYPGLILPFLITPLGVFLMRQFISGLPDDIIEAARIDGASEWRIFLRVIMPLCGPAVATLTILTFLGSWNNFLWPLVVLNDQEKFTLPVAVATFAIGEYTTDYGLLMAGSVVLIAPVIVLFIALQRYFVPAIALPAQVRTRRTRN